MEEYPKPVTKQCMKAILEQMNHNIIYKINPKNDSFSSGFFCYIKKRKNKKIPVVIINTYIVDEKLADAINIIINDEVKTIKTGYIKYRNKELNISMLEIKEYENYNINFLEIDDNIYNKDIESYYNKESIYIMNYKNENNISISFGVINNINESQMKYSTNIYPNLHGSPIFNLSNNSSLSKSVPS